MSYVCDIQYNHNSMDKREIFDTDLQELAQYAKVISHPARLAILKFLSEAQSCISGDISDSIPLSRTTVSQHLKELKKAGLIKGEIEGLKINYCINTTNIQKFKNFFFDFFDQEGFQTKQEYKC